MGIGTMKGKRMVFNTCFHLCQIPPLIGKLPFGWWINHGTLVQQALLTQLPKDHLLPISQMTARQKGSGKGRKTKKKLLGFGLNVLNYVENGFEDQREGTTQKNRSHLGELKIQGFTKGKTKETFWRKGLTLSQGLGTRRRRLFTKFPSGFANNLSGVYP